MSSAVSPLFVPTAFHARWGDADGEDQFAAYCQSLFDHFNQRDFGGRLSPVRIRVSDGNQTRSEFGYSFYGRYLCQHGGPVGVGEGEPGRSHPAGGPVIELDYQIALRPRKLRLVLLHEMLHHYEHESERDPARAWPPLECPIASPPYLGAALELAFLLTDDADVRRWIARELCLPWGPEDDGRTQFYLCGHSHRFVVAAYNLGRLHRRARRWYYV
jgi:hypothetical protein